MQTPSPSYLNQPPFCLPFLLCLERKPNRKYKSLKRYLQHEIVARFLDNHFHLTN